jgi:hypothetical protein
VTNNSSAPRDGARNRQVAPEATWRLPLVAPLGLGVVTPACEDRSEIFPVPLRTAIGLRIGGEINLCFACGPEGSVYHPAPDLTISQLRTLADKLPFATGYDPADLTPAVMAAYEAEMQQKLGLPKIKKDENPDPKRENEE